MNQPVPDTPAQTAPRWQPLPPIARRIVGVLVEKAKTTPDQYPLTENALRAGANQKSNRFPIMHLEPVEIEESLETLRRLGAVIEVQGSGRVPRYRHLMHEWLGVDRVELAVMTELLLRGAQTVGELRGRAARMEPIADLAALYPCLNALEGKGLIEYLTPEGRGCVVTHSLYGEDEMRQLRAQYAASGHVAAAPTGTSARARAAGAAPVEETAARRETAAAGGPPVGSDAATRREVDALRDELSALRMEIDAIRNELETHCGESERVLEEIHRQLGAI